MEIAQFVTQQRWRWLTLVLATCAVASVAACSAAVAPVRYESTVSVGVVAPTGVNTPIADAATAELAVRAVADHDDAQGRRDGPLLLVSATAADSAGAEAVVVAVAQAALTDAYASGLDELRATAADAGDRVTTSRLALDSFEDGSAVPDASATYRVLIDELLRLRGERDRLVADDAIDDAGAVQERIDVVNAELAELDVVMPEVLRLEQALAAAEAEHDRAARQVVLAEQRLEALRGEAAARVTAARQVSRTELALVRATIGAGVGLFLGAFAVAVATVLLRRRDERRAVLQRAQEHSVVRGVVHRSLAR